MKTSLYMILLAVMAIFLNSCSSNNKPKTNPSDETEAILDHARKTVVLNFGTLSGELKRAISEGGVEEAVQYCNINALALTDSLAGTRNTIIRRATDRPRNSLNELNAREQSIFNHYQRAIIDGLPYSDTLVFSPNQKIYYAPIHINELCLKCHGDPTTIEEYNIIKKLYPSDRATGYRPGDLRGIWSVSYLTDSTLINNKKWALE